MAGRVPELEPACCRRRSAGCRGGNNRARRELHEDAIEATAKERVPRCQQSAEVAKGGSMMGLVRCIVAVSGCWIGQLSSIRAHDPGISTAQGELRDGRLELTTGFAPADVEHLLPPTVPRVGKWSQAEFEAVQEQLLAIAPKLWEVRAGETLLPARGARVELLPGDNVSFHLGFVPAPGTGQLTLSAPRIPDLPEGHRQFVIIADDRGSTRAKKLLSARDYSIEVRFGAELSPSSGPTRDTARSTPSATEQTQTALAFVRLGVEHIWTGYDHLLFLFALLVVCRSFRSIVGIVTCFTVAHSLTLALATLDVVNLPSRLVEGMIAASIVFVGVENLISRGEEPRGRWAVTFVFGLVHGFGFASVLRDLGVGGGGSGLLMPLFTFNLGVELGQVAVAAVVLPIVWWLRKKESFLARGVPALSLVVTGAGLFWLLQRTVLN